MTKKEELKNLLYQEACQCIDRGWSIIPLSMTGKKPLAEWKQYQTRLTTQDEVDEWFDKGAPTSGGGRVEIFNLALITGSISGVIVLDCDNEESVQYAKKHNLQSPFSVKTVRGKHYYFAHPQHGKRFANKVGGIARDWVDVQGLDLRGDGGYVVMPPSIKLKDGKATHQYSWELAETFDWDDLSDFPWKGKPTDTIEPEIEREFSFDTMDLTEVKVANIEDTLTIFEQTELRVKHLGRKLTDGDGTDGWMVRYCGQMVRRGLVGDDLFQSVLNYHDKFFDYGRHSQEETEGWLKVKMQSALQMDMRNYPDDYKDGVRINKREKLPLVSNEDQDKEVIEASRLVPIYIDAVERILSSIQDEPYWCDPLIPEATITQVVGFNGHGKSYLLSALLTSLCAGNESFGPYEMGKPAKVFYMDYDNPRRTALRRMQNFNKTFGDTNEHFGLWSPTLITPEDGGEMNLMEEKDFRLLGEWLEKVKPNIVVIDTIRNAFRGMDENSPSEWAKVNFVAKSIRNKGISVILVHHRNKPGEGGLGREAGSTAQLTDVDTQVFVSQVYQDKADAKAKAGLLDKDLTIYTLDRREFSPFKYLEALMPPDSRLNMVTQVSFGKVRQQTELHQTHYIGWCEDLLTGNTFIVSTKSLKQKAKKLSLSEGKSASEISRLLMVPRYEIERWLGISSET